MSPKWRKSLLRRDPSVIVCRVGDPGAPPFQSPDPLILEWCEANNFILVTNNRVSMPGHLADHLAAGRHVPGILVILGGPQAGPIMDELVVIAGASLPDEYQDQLLYLPMLT